MPGGKNSRISVPLIMSVVGEDIKVLFIFVLKAKLFLYTGNRNMDFNLITFLIHMSAFILMSTPIIKSMKIKYYF